MVVIGNQLQASVSGVDVGGATFLLNDVILTRGVVFAYSAFFRSNKPLRFQIWRPELVNQKSFRLISETRVIPSVVLDREDVSTEYLLLKNYLLIINTGWTRLIPLSSPKLSKLLDFRNCRTVEPKTA